MTTEPKSLLGQIMAQHPDGDVTVAPVLGVEMIDPLDQILRDAHLSIEVETWFPSDLRCIECGQPFSGGQWVESTNGVRHIDCPKGDQ